MDPYETKANPYAHPAETPTQGFHESPDPPERRSILDLLIRPTRFFAQRRFDMHMGILVVFVVLYGVVGVVDSVESRASMGNVSPVLSSWGGYFAFIALGGCVAGLLAFGILGWWYRMRVRWAGDRSADPMDARKLFFVAATIRVVPFFLVTLVESLVYPSPAAAIYAGSLWYVLLLIFPYWSQLASYKGVRAVFDVSKWGARFWFLILPWITTTVFLAMIISAYFLAASSIPPDIKNTARYDGLAFTLTYPGNWWVFDDEAGYDPRWSIAIEPPQDAALDLSLYFADGEELAKIVVDQLDADIDAGFRITNSEQTTRWGPIEGEGVRSDGELDGSALRIEHFVSHVADGWVMIVREAVVDESRDIVEPGLRLVRRSITPHSPALRPPDLDNPRTLRAGGIRLDIPGDWEDLVTDGDHQVFVEVQPPQNAYFSMNIYFSDLTIGDEAKVTIDGHRVPESEVTDGPPFDQWGSWTGAGRRVTVNPDEGDPYEVEVFVALLEDGRYLEVEIRVIPEHAAICQDGFDLIRKTLRAE